jgi:SNF2 family DNA or RNA helicase
MYGTVIRGTGGWGIRCEPHVAARLKRVFPRMAERPTDIIRITDTPENSRELLWFLQRYPMNVPQLEYLQQRAAEHVAMETRLADLLAGHIAPAAFDLAKPPREYQRFAATMLEVRGGLLLADDVGLGKTVTAICPMAVPDNIPAVVVAPAHLPAHWAEKLAEFAPSLRVHVLSKGSPYPLVRKPGQRRSALWDTLPDVIVTSYHKLRGWAEVLGELAKYVVFDECQQLRHPGSGIYHAASYLARRTRRRLGLSATPIYNYGSEFWPVIEPLIPGALGGYDEFVREWCVGSFGEKAKLKDSELFGAYLRREGIMLRRTRKDVGRELPKVTKVPHVVESDSKVLEQLSGDAVALAKVILSHNERFRGERMQAAGQFDGIVRQATGVAKAPYVAEFVRILAENGEKVVLFGWHREVYSIWLEKLADLKPVLYSGSESAREKQAAKDAFVEGDSRVLVMSLRSGAGVDGLQHVCSTAVFGELDWSPGVHEQCVGRVDRDGQKTPVMAYFLMSQEGSDPIVADVLGIKREQIEGVRNPGQGLIERVDIGENQLRRLAAEFLTSRGIAAPTEKPAIVAQLFAEEPEATPA